MIAAYGLVPLGTVILINMTFGEQTRL